MSQPKPVPPGVETTPTGPYVSLQEAAERLGRDPRTLIRAITAGELRGGAIPRPQRLRWYVYEDALPGRRPSPAPPVGAELDDLRAQLVTQLEVNRLLIAAQQNLLAGESAAEKYRAAAQQYLDALAQFVTPGHLGELTAEL
jgi:hypothetical protein